ncbi:MAG: hypothetical protein ACRD0Q_07185, partial [Acidimicrobiales bacterium]
MSARPLASSGEPRRTRWSVIDLAAYDRSGRLTNDESETLERLGPTGLRRNRARGVPRRTTALSWKALARLVDPLDAARVALHHRDDARHRRAGLHAVGLVLEGCEVLGRSYW